MLVHHGTNRENCHTQHTVNELISELISVIVHLSSDVCSSFVPIQARLQGLVPCGYM